MTKEQKLEKLIEEIEKKDKARGLPDAYLREHNYMTREELGIGEYSYGVIMIPIDFVLDYLKELQEVLSMLKEKDERIEYYRKQKDYDMQFRHELLEEIRCLNLDKDEKDAEIEKKDRQIELMAQFIATLDIEEDICANVENNNCDKMALGECENCIKQYFAGLVEKE